MTDRRSFIRNIFLGGIAVLSGHFGFLSPGFGSQESPQDSPNIVFILIDDMGWKDAGCTGSKYYLTPNIDNLASEGMLFKNGYSAAPVCSPSRGAIYSGKYPARTKLTTVFRGGDEDDERLYRVSKFEGGSNEVLEGLHRHVLPASEITFAEALAGAGYATGFFGKWHCGWGPEFRPDKQGFHVAEGYRLSSKSTRGHFGKSFKDNIAGIKEIKDDDYIADVLTDRAVAFIETNKEKPFLCMLSHYLVHSPIDPKPEYVPAYEERPAADQNNPKYAAMVQSVDESVGRLVGALKNLGLEEKTMFIFTSDNGGLTPKNTSNYPLMGGKSFPYEAGMRVPFIIKWPGKIKPGQQEDTRVLGVDFYPTILEAAGVKVPDKQIIDGVSLIPLLLKGAGKLAPRPIFFHFPHYTHATGPFSSVIENGWKLIRFYNKKSGEFQLFHLARDEWEQKDMAKEMPERVDKLRQRMESWLKEVGAEMPRPNPDYKPGFKKHKDKSFTWKKAKSERELFEKRLKMQE